MNSPERRQCIKEPFMDRRVSELVFINNLASFFIVVVIIILGVLESLHMLLSMLSGELFHHHLVVVISPLRVLIFPFYIPN